MPNKQGGLNKPGGGGGRNFLKNLINRGVGFGVGTFEKSFFCHILPCILQSFPSSSFLEREYLSVSL